MVSLEDGSADIAEVGMMEHTLLTIVRGDGIDMGQCGGKEREHVQRKSTQ